MMPQELNVGDSLYRVELAGKSNLRTILFHPGGINKVKPCPTCYVGDRPPSGTTENEPTPTIQTNRYLAMFSRCAY